MTDCFILYFICFISGVGDSVRCYFCGGGLRNWEHGDVPMEEHAKWYPKCPHILLVKGQAYVDKLSRGEKPDEDVASIQVKAWDSRYCFYDGLFINCLYLEYK